MKHEIVLLTRSNGCPNCQSVKSVFAALGVHPREVDVDHHPTVAAPFLAAATSRSLPLLFVDGENVSAGLDCIKEIRKYAN